MALNKMMHPRNPFKERKPDFKALATKYKEFRQHAIADIQGRVHLDFKKPESLRALSWALLKEEFNLDVDMPMNRLIPTIPLRINYILWLEDLINKDKDSTVSGIDIGTGSACIYPLLGAKKNGWHFLATESDEFSYNFAQKNIDKNSLESQIKVIRSNPKEILLEPLQLHCTDDQKFDFCMSNPPFFGSNMEAWGMTATRSEDRSEPKSISTASPGESIFPGGEVEFVRAMISDSHQLKHQIRIFSSMLGKKSSLTILKEDLKRTGVPVYGTTEFCQGRTMRWGLAWSFDESITFTKNPMKTKKMKKPVEFTIPKESLLDKSKYCVEGALTVFQNILKELQMEYSQRCKTKHKVSLLVKAKSNTWSNQRRKRRQQQRDQNLNCKKETEVNKRAKLDTDDKLPRTQDIEIQSDGQSILTTDSDKSENTVQNVVDINSIKDRPSENTVNKSETSAVECAEISEKCSGIKSGDVCSKNTIDSRNGTNSCKETKCQMENGEDSGECRNISGDNLEEETKLCNMEECSYILTFVLSIYRSEDNIVIGLEWVDGTDIQLLHQVLQYIKNKFKM